jgi:hypothetical protein
VFNYFKQSLPDNELLSGIMAFSLMLIAPVVIPFTNDPHLYVGKFTSTIWHNSTTIFVFPFCIWLFVQSINYLNKPSDSTFGKLLFFSLLILLSKPSFLFAFGVAFPIICIVRFGWDQKWFLYTILLSVIILICLIVEKDIIYQNNVLNKLVYKGETSKIIIAPFKVWLRFAFHPFIYFLTSFLFIFSFIVIKFSKIKKDVEILYSLLLLTISLFIYFMLAESGPRFFHSNFYWQIPISMLIINMVMLKKLFIPYTRSESNKITLKIISLQDKLLLFIYSLHFVSGVYYTLRILIEKTYY